MTATTKTKLLRIYAVAGSWVLIAFVLALSWKYNGFIHSPGQGGWSIYRAREFGRNILPWLIIAILSLAPWWRLQPMFCVIGYTLFAVAGLFLVYVCVELFIRIHDLPVGTYLFLLIPFTTYIARILWFISIGHRPKTGIVPV
jgi:hypothetical protein